MCFGTFDLIHLGHVDYFRQAKEHGDYLVVVIARDVTKEIQEKQVIFSEEERLELIKNLGVVDEVVLGYKDDHFRVIREHKPDVICLGYDHRISEEELRLRLEKFDMNPVVLRMQAYKAYKHKSSVLKEQILDNL